MKKPTHIKDQLRHTMFINPVKRQSVQGRDKYSIVTPGGEVKSMNRTASKDATKRYSFPTDPNNPQRLVTGLDEMIDNPWFGDEPNKIPEERSLPASWYDEADKLVKQEKITKQMYLEILAGVPKGTYTAEKSLNPNISRRLPNDRATVLESFYIILYDKPNKFTDDSPRGRLAQQLAKVSKRIADSKNDINPNRHHFYISEENEAAIERAAKEDIINNAVTDLTILRRKNDEFMSYQIAVVLGLVEGQVQPVIVKDKLNQFIKDKSKNQMDNIEKFNQLIKLLDTGGEGLKKFYVMYLVKQAVNSNVMSVSSGQYIWHSKKGIDNLYQLGNNRKLIHKMFYDELNKYDPELDADNLYKDLAYELRNKGIRINEEWL